MDSSTTTSDMGELTQKGIALIGLGMFNEAIMNFDRALAIDPNLKPALTSKGVALNNLGRYGEAIKFL